MGNFLPKAASLGAQIGGIAGPDIKRKVQHVGQDADHNSPPQQVMFLQADITQLAADTGFAPRTAFADGIRATIAWAKTQKQTN